MNDDTNVNKLKKPNPGIFKKYNPIVVRTQLTKAIIACTSKLCATKFPNDLNFGAISLYANPTREFSRLLTPFFIFFYLR